MKRLVQNVTSAALIAAAAQAFGFNNLICNSVDGWPPYNIYDTCTATALGCIGACVKDITIAPGSPACNRCYGLPYGNCIKITPYPCTGTTGVPGTCAGVPATGCSCTYIPGTWPVPVPVTGEC